MWNFLTFMSCGWKVNDFLGENTWMYDAKKTVANPPALMKPSLFSLKHQ